MKAKITLSLSLAVVMLAALAVPALAAPAFTDIAGNPYEEYIEYCAGHGFMSGYGDGTFKPNGTMTRFEVSNVICKYFKYRINHTFKDIPQMSLENNAAVLMYAHGYLEGYEDNTFRINALMTREQAALMVMKICGLSVQDEGVLPSIDFHDKAAVSAWARDAVKAVSQYRIMVGDPDGSFNPKSGLTRGELCRILWDITEEEWKKVTPPEPEPTVINAEDLDKLSDLTPEEADGTDPAPETLTVAGGAHFTAAVSWAGLTGEDKIDPGTSVGTVTLTANSGYTFTGTDIDADALKAVFVMGGPEIVIGDNTGETLVFTLSY